MVLRRRDIQLPKPPVTNDKAASNWMTAVSSLLQKYIFGGSDDRLVSAKELIDSGVVGVGTGGQITQPPKNLTKPPKVTGLTANGALASIFVQWSNPSFSNYGYTELWRADIDDIGQAFLIASTAVESYTDNVGSAATKYYWARAVSDQGVKGDFNAVNGVKGTTSLDPDYVMQVLTSSTWKPNTTYYPFQYVRPTVDNGFQYAAVDGGKSGSVEPTWPTTINTTVNDGTIQWTTVPIDARIPFVLGALEDGTPAVFMDTAYIKNASITSAKIGELIADKITTGNLVANVQLLSKLWAGFSEFANAGQAAGLWIGIDGDGKPKLKLDTGLANGNKKLYFDGVDLKIENVDLISSADGYFDDLSGDSVIFNRAVFKFLAFSEHVTPSKYVYDNDIKASEPEFENYLCYPNGCAKTQSWTSATLYLGNGYAGNFAFFQTGIFDKIYPYDYSDKNTKYRALDKNIGFQILISSENSTPGLAGNYYGGSWLDIYIFSENQALPSNNYNSTSATTNIPSRYLLKIPVTFRSNGKASAYQNNGSGDVKVFDVDVFDNSNNNPYQILIECQDDLQVLDFKVGRTLKIAVVYKDFWQAGPGNDTFYTGEIRVDFRVNVFPKTSSVPNNDERLGITILPPPEPPS